MNEPLTQSGLATARGEIAQLGKELENCQAALAKAEAACAEVSFLLRQVVYARSSIGTKFIDEFEAWKLDSLEQRIVVALSSDRGSALLARVANYESALKQIEDHHGETEGWRDIARNALSGTTENALLKELEGLKGDIKEHYLNLTTLREREKRLREWLEKKIAEAKEACKKATPFDFERGSDLTAYTAVKNFLKREGWV